MSTPAASMSLNRRDMSQPPARKRPVGASRDLEHGEVVVNALQPRPDFRRLLAHQAMVSSERMWACTSMTRPVVMRASSGAGMLASERDRVAVAARIGSRRS